MSSVDIATARAAKKHLAADLAGHAGVTGIGIKPVSGGYALKVDLMEDAPEPPVPHEVDGVDVHVEVTGIGFPQAAFPA